MIIVTVTEREEKRSESREQRQEGRAEKENEKENEGREKEERRGEREKERRERGRAQVQHASVCTLKRPPCVPAKRPHVFNMRIVLPIHTETI